MVYKQKIKIAPKKKYRFLYIPSINFLQENWKDIFMLDPEKMNTRQINVIDFPK